MSPDFKNGFDVPDDQKERHYDVFEEVVVISGYLRKHGILSKINEQVRFARKRFGRYEVIDFLMVLFGYAVSGERTLDMRCSGLLRSPSWPCLTERDCPPARRSRAFLRA